MDEKIERILNNTGRYVISLPLAIVAYMIIFLVSVWIFDFADRIMPFFVEPLHIEILDKIEYFIRYTVLTSFTLNLSAFAFFFTFCWIIPKNKAKIPLTITLGAILILFEIVNFIFYAEGFYEHYNVILFILSILLSVGFALYYSEDF